MTSAFRLDKQVDKIKTFLIIKNLAWVFFSALKFG